MHNAYITGQTFEAQDTLEQGEYEHCVFRNCHFGSGDLSACIFADCTFSECDLSLATLHKTAFREVVFRNCKMLGLRFDTCNALGLSFSFEDCQLQHASFFQTKIKGTVFKNVQLQEADFAEAGLSGCLFERCNLQGAVFDHTNLEQADLRTAFHYSIDPEKNKIKRAKFSFPGMAGLLDKYDLHIEGRH